MITFNEWFKEKNDKNLYEGKKHKNPKKSKKKDVTGDGKADFADVMASRMIASGVPKHIAIAKAKKHEGK